MAFVLVQHREPRHDESLLEMLRRSTPLPVVEARHDQALRPNQVHVVPAAAGLTIERGLLRVGPPPRGSRPPVVDVFLRSLARDAQGRAIGVILAGAGTDGTAGLCDIKAAGGLTFAQDERSARISDMPRSAASSGCVDFILPPDEIGRRLMELARHPELFAAAQTPSADELYRRILVTVRAATGMDFRHYRDTTIKRRIVRRLLLQGQHSLAEYARRLEEDRDESEALYRDLLINVTSFFRDPELFEALKRTVFPAIHRDKTAETPLRIWVPGCSTGQEAYSLAIALAEFLEGQPVRPPVQIFATDLSDTIALARARAGVYPRSIEAEVSPTRLRRFFRREGDTYVVDRSIRDWCVFAQHNVATDPPFIRVDLVSCRNVLIYMAAGLQHRVLQTFHYALNTPGFLVLGASESPAVSGNLFAPLERSEKIFVKQPSATRVFPPMLGEGASFLATAGSRGGASGAANDFQREVDRVLGRFAPPAVIVNEQFDVIQFRGRTGAYLEAPSGDPTSNVLRLAREGVSIELKRGLIEARSRGETVRRSGVRVPGESGAIFDLEILPLKSPSTGERCFLVLFHEVGLGARATVAEGRAAPPEPRAPTPTRGIAAWLRRRRAGGATPEGVREENQRLQQELQATREYLQSLVEQQDAANEELRSANEEVLSSNEELQSTNEELQTAKEELQSTNEELTTVNEQLQLRNAELTQANNDLANLLANIAIPVIIVGRELRIRRFTPAAGALLNLDPSDVGRPIGHLSTSIDVSDLEEMLTDVLQHVRAREREVTDRHGHSYALRMHPYHTAEGTIDGAVIVLVDITDLRRGEAAERELAAIVTSSEDAIVGKALDGTITSWNEGAERLYGFAAHEVIGLPVSVLVPFGHEDEFPHVVERLRRGERVHHFETVRRRKDGRLIDVSISYSPVRDARGDIVAASVIARDISERKRAVEHLRFQLAADTELASLVDYESTLQKVAQLAVPAFADWCVIDMLDAEGAFRRLAVAHHDPKKVEMAEELGRRYPARPDAERGPANVARSGQSEMMTDIPDALLVAAAQDDHHLRLLRELGLRSYMAVPLRVRGDVVGVITFIASAESGRRYGETDLRTAEDLAVRAGIAIENARLYGELKEADQRKDEFLAMLSHELRNPLAPIRSAIDILNVKGSSDPDLQTARDVIDRQVRQMVRLVDDLLDISRITRGKITLHPRPVDVEEILRGAVESSRPMIEAGAHELVVSYPPAPLWLHADPVRLTQTLLNLLNNAAKFTPRGGQIWLTAAREGPEHGGRGTVVITVRDTGVGIPAAALPSIFDLFAQGERAMDGIHGGLGVGLTLVRSLVELHGGSVTARSAGIGQGSEFVVRLPEGEAPSDPSAHDEPSVAAASTSAPRRVLVVDDNRDQTDSLAALLALCGHEVRTAYDGPGALTVLQDFVPDVALVDIGLPGMNGYEVARHIRGRPGLEHVVLVAQTGWGQEEHRRRSREAGFDEHLTKPVDFEALQALLARLDEARGGRTD